MKCVVKRQQLSVAQPLVAPVARQSLNDSVEHLCQILLCSVLQCVAASCSVLQYVAMCCSATFTICREVTRF